ncbi:MAG: ABC transporter ATP-binding protein [Bacteroidota bacterium]
MLELQNICLSYPGFSLNDISFKVSMGEYFILLGPSGSGKSMLLEMIAGLSAPKSGKIFLDGISVENGKPQDREAGLVFQDHAIFPHLTVRGNIGYALKGQTYHPLQKQQLIKSIAERMQIEQLLDRLPSTLSGGELQRVALARTLVQKPKVLLLDEPLASIDTKLKTDIRSLLRQLNREGQTIIHVTHDFDEAISLAHSIAIIHEGKIVQVGSPAEVFNSPRSEFVAHFVGIRNFFKVKIKETLTGCVAQLTENIEVASSQKLHSGQGHLMIRGEHLTLTSENTPASQPNTFTGRIIEVSASRTGFDVLIDLGFQLHASVGIELQRSLNLVEGKVIWVHFTETSTQIITA